MGHCNNKISIISLWSSQKGHWKGPMNRILIGLSPINIIFCSTKHVNALSFGRTSKFQHRSKDQCCNFRRRWALFTLLGVTSADNNSFYSFLIMVGTFSRISMLMRLVINWLILLGSMMSISSFLSTSSNFESPFLHIQHYFPLFHKYPYELATYPDLSLYATQIP